MKAVIASLILLAGVTAAQADIWSDLGFPANTYGDPENPAGNYATTVGYGMQSDCANVGKILGAPKCVGNNDGREKDAEAKAAAAAAKARGATDAEAARIGHEAGYGARPAGSNF